MEESKDEKAHKVFIERLTLGVTRVLGKIILLIENVVFGS